VIELLKEIKDRTEKDAETIKTGMYPFDTKQVYKDRAELIKMVEEAKETILELLKFGTHEGPCDNYEGGACEQHLEAAEERVKKANDFLKKLEGEGLG
jgi:hypothetical protein